MTYSNNAFTNALTSLKQSYGEVPFYWWNGSPLEKDRLKEQIELLAQKGIAGVQINYAHYYNGGEADLPYGGYGKTIIETPEQFSDEWWDFFEFAAKECEKHGMGIGMGDYTIAWIGNGFFTDKVADTPNMNATKITCEKQRLFSGDEACFDDSVLCAVYYSDLSCASPVVIYERGKGVLNEIKGICEGYIIKTQTIKNSIDPLNKDCGKLLTDYYFEEFERRLPQLKEGTLNYFFQDELMFGTDVRYIWNESLRDKINEKYGYDALGFLPHLFFSLGDITPKIRLDIADVKTSLCEENYFKPIFEFHNSRGRIYGCDQMSRGKYPGEFTDYFRCVRWFTAPGNDTPGRAADLIKVKVSSSIADLYDRPRVWLEGYHSSGWGTTLESITAPTSDNYIFGANLLNLHGLYYSTNAGFFEWAPPDFHFRMPYWDDEKAWLDKYKRLSQLLTTGKHSCDVAVYYPVSSCDYGENDASCIDCTFELSEYLFSHGVDFNFIDFQSIENSYCTNGNLITKNSLKFKALIFAGVDCIRYSSIVKAKELLSCGGVVIFSSITPYADDIKGLNHNALLNDIKEILSHPNAILASTPKEALAFINSKITRSFLPENIYSDNKIFVHQRILNDDKLFFVRYAEKDSVCRFKAQGRAYLLDSDNGDIYFLSGTVYSDGFTFIKMPLEANRDTLILFTNEEIQTEKEINTAGFSTEEVKEVIHLDGYWDFSLIPTLDNKYGDYYLPKSGIIGPQARFFDISKENSPESEIKNIAYNTDISLQKAVCNEPMELCRYIAGMQNDEISNTIDFNGEKYVFNPATYNSRYGYFCMEDSENDLIEQGYHGLKGRLYNDNIYFSESCVYFTFVASKCDTKAKLFTGSIKPICVYLNGKMLTSEEVHLKKGKNLLCFAYLYQKDLCPDYKNKGSIKRTQLYITEGVINETSYPLAINSFANNSYFKFSNNFNENNIYHVKFKSAPGLKSLKANVFGKIIKAFNNEVEMTVSYLKQGNFNGNLFSIECEQGFDSSSDILLIIEAENFCEYANIIAEPIDLFCEKGKIECGDLSKTGALISYSGKCVYEKTINITKLYPDEKFYLDIKDASACLNIEINEKPCVVFTYKPFYSDITDYLINGENKIKITVSNTLCNHYSTIPSRYSHFPKDAKYGLIGPVDILVKESKSKED